MPLGTIFGTFVLMLFDQQREASKFKNNWTFRPQTDGKKNRKMRRGKNGISALKLPEPRDALRAPSGNSGFCSESDGSDLTSTWGPRGGRPPRPGSEVRALRHRDFQGFPGASGKVRSPHIYHPGSWCVCVDPVPDTAGCDRSSLVLLL